MKWVSGPRWDDHKNTKLSLSIQLDQITQLSFGWTHKNCSISRTLERCNTAKQVVKMELISLTSGYKFISSLRVRIVNIGVFLLPITRDCGTHFSDAVNRKWDEMQQEQHHYIFNLIISKAKSLNGIISENRKNPLYLICININYAYINSIECLNCRTFTLKNISRG